MATSDTTNFASIADAVQSTSTGVNNRMKDFAADQAARAARLIKVRDRLRAAPNPPAEKLQALAESIAYSSDLAQALGSMADRIAGRPVDPNDLAVFGRVVDASGAGIPFLWVRLTNKAATLTLGNRVQTNGAGDFSLVLRSSDIRTSPPTLVVAVENANGRRLGTSDPVTLTPAAPAYVEVQVTSNQAGLPAAGSTTPKLGKRPKGKP